MALPSSAAPPGRHQRGREILLAQVRLLYLNTPVGVCVTVIAASLLGYLQWGLVSHAVIVWWWVYTAAVAGARYATARRFRLASPGAEHAERWARFFAVGAGLAGVGWGGAGILLYPEHSPIHQVFLVFVVGGMMLGAVSLLSPRPEASLAFLIPSGLGTAARFVLQADQMPLAMGLLAAVFTGAVLITSWRSYRMLHASLQLQYENRDLVEELRTATRQTEELNQVLEQRVQQRTVELTQAAEQLRAEIANRERTEEELLRARKLESLGVLAGGIAHDFNNFLAVIQGNIEIAKQSLDAGTPVQEILDAMTAACRRAAFLSSQLLTFAKGGAPVRRLVSMKNLVMDAIQLVRAGSSTGIIAEIPEDLCFAYVDPGQIGQVLHNVLLNARQAMREGGIIEVRAENAPNPDANDPEPHVRIAIRDFGAGIPAEVRPRIFDPYFTTKPGGSGLGLATAYAIVSKHGGSIMVESTPGLGSVFTIDLPASNRVPVVEPAAALTPVAAQGQAGTGRLLVMDDEEQLRKLLESVLSGLGYEVQSAREGAETLALFEEAKAKGKPFHAVLLDLTVSGGMGGVETAAKLKELDPSSRLIVSSGYSASPVMSDFAKYGFDAVLPKPWTIPELSLVLQRVLAGARQKRTDR